MGTEHLPEYIPKLVKKKNGTIETWDLEPVPADDVKNLTHPPLEASNPVYVTETDPTGGKSQRLHETKKLNAAQYGDTGQEALARELSDLPLRGDSVKIPRDGGFERGTIEDYYTVEGKKYALLVNAKGEQIPTYLSELSVEKQAEFDAIVDQEVGEAVVEVVQDQAAVAVPKGEALNDLMSGNEAAKRLMYEDILASLDARDLRELTSYAIATSAKDPGIANQNLNRMSATARDIAGEYAARYNVNKPDDTPQEPVIKNLDKVMNAEPETAQQEKQRKYDAVKGEIAALTSNLSEDDKYYLDKYADAVLRGDNQEAAIIPSFSKELIMNSDLTNQYVALRRQKDDFFVTKA